MPDRESPSAYGQIAGYNVIASCGGKIGSNYNNNYYTLLFALTDGLEPLSNKVLKALTKSSKCIIGCFANDRRVEVIVKGTGKDDKQIEMLRQAMNEAISFFMAKGYRSCCQQCGQVIETLPAVISGVEMHLCDHCYQTLSVSNARAQEQKAKKKNSIIVGVIGALLGSLIGVLCIVILGQLGYVAALSGIVMAVCTLKGYELLYGKLDVKGFVIGAVIMAAMTFIGYQLDYAITVAKYFEVDIFSAFRGIPELIREEVIEEGAYYWGLIQLYAFNLLGYIPVVISKAKEVKDETITYRMQR